MNSEIADHNKGDDSRRQVSSAFQAALRARLNSGRRRAIQSKQG